MFESESYLFILICETDINVGELVKYVGSQNKTADMN